MKRIQHQYIYFTGCLVLLLALLRCAVPSVSPRLGGGLHGALAADSGSVVERSLPTDTVSMPSPLAEPTDTVGIIANRQHAVKGVLSYEDEFPDTNDLQLTSAKRWGVDPVENRADAEQRKMDLVYVGASPYYRVMKLNNSIPYLVPRAALLLQDIGRAYYDSLVVKGLPLHQLLVSSILRTNDDVSRLRRSNRNATENSCHLYGTTFDIAYNKYQPLTVKGSLVRREVPSDTLKWVLSEVLRDMRKAQRCYIKHEVKQGCFHITVR